MKSPLRVLLVEDAPDDALLLERHTLGSRCTGNEEAPDEHDA